MCKKHKPTIGVILGPTACGKTAVSILSAKRLNAEIISADSIQVYRGLDIGSAKPSLAERDGIIHHLLDVADVSNTDFSVAQFQMLADQCIEDIISRGKFPLIVGGTGLYINSLTYPLQFSPAPGDPAVRSALQKAEAAQPGSSYQRLQDIDPDSAKRLHPNDIKRVIRALEVFEVSGRTLTSYGYDFSNQEKTELRYHPIIVGLTMDRAKLYERIERRIDLMMEQGLLEETKAFFDAGFPASLPALQGLGYKQLYRYLAGEISLDQAVSDIKIETRHFAKRQFTWFRRDDRIHWLSVNEAESIQSLSDRIVEIMKGE